jgi:hypothetical protein
MFALYDDERAFLARLSGFLIAGAAAVLPFTLPPQSVVASASAIRPARPLAVPAVPRGLAFPAVDLTRDPFVADASFATLAAGGRSGTDGSGTVRAVVLGDHSRALVEIGGVVRVFGAGDAIGSDRILSIDDAGVTMKSGRRLNLVRVPQP